jgi:hypothetical protein
MLLIPRLVNARKIEPKCAGSTSRLMSGSRLKYIVFACEGSAKEMLMTKGSNSRLWYILARCLIFLDTDAAQSIVARGIRENQGLRRSARRYLGGPGATNCTKSADAP